MSEYYDHYHRWEPLAEFHFCIDPEVNLYDEDDDNYIYCLCSRVFIRDAVKTYYVVKDEASESEGELQLDNQTKVSEDESHVHFSLDTSYKSKCEKDEGASCYCSASHTENYCSTDEHDVGQIPGLINNVLQPSDSGADLTYPDCNSENNHEKLGVMYEDSNDLAEISENYLAEDTWDKFWAVNGERIIWASWIKKYSDYINPQYLDENKELLVDSSKGKKQLTPDTAYSEVRLEKGYKYEFDNNAIRERKFSYDSKVNPYTNRSNITCNNSIMIENKNVGLTINNDDTWLPITRRRSCSEHDGSRILSPRTVTGTDSMTNVTKITISSYDVNSSHVTSESSPSDEYSVSSSSSDDQSNDKTKIANVDEADFGPLDDLDTEQYWQFLWKKHFGEQYALHCANYIECHQTFNYQTPSINIETLVSNSNEEKPVDVDYENSEGNSQETPTVVEVQDHVQNLNLDGIETRPKKFNKKSNRNYVNSVGVLLQKLLQEEQVSQIAPKNKLVEAGSQESSNGDPNQTYTRKESTADNVNNSLNSQPVENISAAHTSTFDDGDNDPPEDKPITLKRSHESDEEESVSEKINSTFDIMGYSTNYEDMPKGELVYRKRIHRLRPPRNKRFGIPKKVYYDDEGNPFELQESQEDETDMATDEEESEIRLDLEKVSETNVPDKNKKVSSNAQTNEFLDVEPKDEVQVKKSEISNEEVNVDKAQETNNENSVVSAKRRKRQRRARNDTSLEESPTARMPLELQGDPRMKKYWRKRFSLFHRFDEGIKLDYESWFSVTPENVARHIATKYIYDVVLDGFCGAGGNTIQFATTCKKVIAIDIDPSKIELAKHNAEVYGVADKVEFIVGDFFEIAPTLQADMVFLSPPWGGPNYSNNAMYDLETMLEPKPVSELMEVARSVSSNVTLYLPRNTRSDQILNLAREARGSVEIEQNYLDRRFVAITAYYYD